MALVDVIIGYAKGAQGDVGPQGPIGPQGPEGPQGPLPALVNNALTTTAGVAALDAVMGKTLQDQITQTNSNLTALTGKLSVSNALMQNGYSATESVVSIAGKFSDYRLLTFMAIWDNGQYVDAITLTSTAFVGTTGGVIILKSVDSTQTISIRYESDGSIKLHCSSTYLTLRIIGSNAK